MTKIMGKDAIYHFASGKNLLKRQKLLLNKEIKK
jgi:hypothetical protein